MGDMHMNAPVQKEYMNQSTPFFNRLQKYMLSHPEFAFFKLFSQYDTQRNGKIADLQTVKTIMSQIPGLSVSERDLDTFYNNWRDQQGQLNFIQLIL